MNDSFYSLFQVDYNRLAVGLVFPQLQDHDLVICTDWTLIQLATEIKMTLDIDVGQDEEDFSKLQDKVSPSSVPTETMDEVDEDGYSS